MRKVIPIVATLDTKEAEARFLHQLIEKQGFKAPIIDVSTNPSRAFEATYSYDNVCRRSGIEVSQLASMRRDRMMQTMGEGAAEILMELYQKQELAGAIAIGGNQGTAIASIAMRSLPIGVPKLIISTVASGYVRPYVEYKDIVMMFSVADFLGGLNTVSRTILTNGAGAVMGMAQHGRFLKKGNKQVIAITAFGNTETAVTRARQILEGKGYEVIAFHASGAGGSAMEYMVEQGFIQGVLDMTTHELIGEVCGDDIYTPLRPRLVEAGKRGIPQVIVPGAMEYFCFGGPDSIPEKYKGRKTHYHNPYNTNVRANREEIIRTAEVVALKLNKATGPVAVLLPLCGFSENGRQGNALFDPEMDLVLIKTLRKKLKREIEVISIKANINDREFAEQATEVMIRLMKSCDEEHDIKLV